MVPRDGRAFLRHLESDNVLLPAGNPAGGFIGRKHTAGAIVMRIFFFLLLFLPYFLQSLRGTETRIGMPPIDKDFYLGMIDLAAVGLTIRTMWPTNVRAFVIIQAKPAQAIHDLLLGARHCARDICIFDTQNELPTGLFGEQVGVQRGASITKMHMPRR